jgi:ureidoacrylate peracid hydrolase
VESTIRDAYFLEYSPVMVIDATMPAGSADIQRATVYNVQTFFCWATTSEDVVTALKDGQRRSGGVGFGGRQMGVIEYISG